MLSWKFKIFLIISDEFLQGYVGLENINNNIKLFQMNHTQNITYINSEAYAFNNYDNLSETAYLSKLASINYSYLL